MGYKSFEFDITQDASSYYKGKISIEANSEKEAVEKIKKLSQKELENLAFNWELADDTSASGGIEVWNKGKLIK